LILFIFVLGFFIFKSNNMLELFLVIEGLSFSAYILAGFEKDTKIASSVGIQYLILGSISSVFLMLAFLLVYNQFGTAVFTNLFLANLEFLKDYFLVNNNNGLESFLVDHNFLDTSKEEVVAWSLFFGINNSMLKSIRNPFLNIFYSLKGILLSFFLVNLFYPKVLEDYKMDLNDFSYLSPKDLNNVLTLNDFGGGGDLPVGKGSFYNPINMATINSPKVGGTFIETKYEALTGIPEDIALEIAAKESEILKEIFIKGFKEKERLSKGNVDFLDLYSDVIKTVKDHPFLPKRWKFEENPIDNWDTVWAKILASYENCEILPSKEEIVEELCNSILQTRKNQMLYIEFEENILVPNEVKEKVMEFNLRVLKDETQDIIVSWEYFVTCSVYGRPLSKITDPRFFEPTYLEGSWFNKPEGTKPFLEFRNGIKMNGMGIDSYGDSNQGASLSFFESFSIEDFNVEQFDFSIYGTILIIIGFLIGTLLYKIKGAPFHIWAPTIYTRMPTASLVVLMTLFTFIFSLYFFQLFLNIFYLYGNIIAQLFLMSGLLSLLFGFLGAFDQKLLKKFFIYSSIGHVAFLLFTFTFFSSIKSELSLIMYLVIYLVSTFLLWYLITFNTQKIEFLSNLLKPVKNNSLFLLVFIVITFSMSGIPPLAGFYIKFDILNLLALSQEFFILFISLLITVASFYYYLRLLKIANFENFSTSLLNTLKVEESWSFLRLFFLFLSSFLLFLFVIVVEQSFYYLNSYLF